MKFIYLIMSILLISACSSAPSYRSAKNGLSGYSERQINSDHYLVIFNSKSINIDEAHNYALLRSAELTLQQGYDWFTVLNKETQIESQAETSPMGIHASQRQTVTRSCSLLHCQTHTSTPAATSAQIQTTSPRKEVTTQLEIKMGKGMKPNSKSYSAQEVIQQHAPSNL